ncbi:MFS transporter [Streptomyces sp. NPDC051677]|uniref:MFS transporter n=1 Tax=Streptomyces sp. NPDC051677 TaxID=3365669 RepID=UPI0037D8A6AF
MFRSLRTLWGERHVRRLLPLSLLARTHLSALPVALSFLIADWTGSYASVGLLSGGMAVGQAVAGPVRGRIADRDSVTGVLFTTGVAYALGLGLLIAVAALAPVSLWPVAVVIAFCTGLALPPVSQISRSVWPRLVEDEQRDALYTLDSTGYELVAMAGPLLATTAVTLGGGMAAVAVCAVLATGGAMAFALVLRAAALERVEPRGQAEPRERAKRSSLLRDPVFRRAVLVAFFLMAALFSLNLSLVAWGRDHDEATTAGVLIALFSLGSAIGGLAVVGRGRQQNSERSIGVLVVGLTMLAVLLPPLSEQTPVWALAVATALTGTAVAPSLGASNARIGDLAPPERRAEAFGWLATATTGGVALIMPMVGWLLDKRGPSASIALGAVAALVSAALAVSLPKPVRPEAAVPAAEVN